MHPAIDVAWRDMMGIKKTMTPKALLANHDNGKRTPGPHNTAFTRMNAIKHALLARNLRFQSEEEKETFYRMMDEFVQYHQPLGRTEHELVWEVGLGFWRLAQVYGWELDEIIHRRDAAAGILQALKRNGDAQHVEQLEPALEGWAAQEIVLRSDSRTSEEKEDFAENSAGKSGQAFVEARLTPPLELITRYAASIRRDIYRALATLIELQRQRLELHTDVPVTNGGSDGKK